MVYLISFLEGIITFISPCLLPMLPVYISYFAGGNEEASVLKTVKNALAFVLGFTVVFVAMGAFAGTIGAFLIEHKKILDIITGLVVVFFGLNFMGVFKINLFKGISKSFAFSGGGFFSAFIFGVVFSVGWTPCVGAFLGSALMMASQQGSVLKGVIMLTAYSTGLGFPFIISAILIDRLKTAFGFIKKHYNVINIVCGVLLVIIGILMISGIMGKYMALVS